MKNTLNRGIFLAILIFAGLGLSCEKEDDEQGSDCYTCTNCSGQYAHLLNDREYCIAGFDTKSDWEANKTAMEQQNSCTCEY